MPVVSTNPSPKPTNGPVITEEADRALSRTIVRYMPLTFLLLFALPMAVIFIANKHPHSAILGEHGLLYYISLVAWLVPFYMGMYKVSAQRLDFGRRYLADHRWKEAAAALGSFDSFGQKSFDRSGEAHYLLAQALDRLGNKDKAQKARDFVRRYRSGTMWAQRIEKETPPAKPQRPRRSDAGATTSDAGSGDLAAAGASRFGAKRASGPSAQSGRARRRRF